MIAKERIFNKSHALPVNGILNIFSCFEVCVVSEGAADRRAVLFLWVLIILAKHLAGFNTFPLRHIKKLPIFKVIYLKKSPEKSLR
jgi:hypothetical protein